MRICCSFRDFFGVLGFVSVLMFMIWFIMGLGIIKGLEIYR